MSCGDVRQKGIIFPLIDTLNNTFLNWAVRHYQRRKFEKKKKKTPSRSQNESFCDSYLNVFLTFTYGVPVTTLHCSKWTFSGPHFRNLFHVEHRRPKDSVFQLGVEASMTRCMSWTHFSRPHCTSTLLLLDSKNTSNVSHRGQLCRRTPLISSVGQS